MSTHEKVWAPTLLGIGFALTGPLIANAQTLTFESATPGPVPNGGEYDEAGMRITSFSDYAQIGDPLNVGTSGNWFYFHGTNQYIEFRRVDGSRFDLVGFDLGNNGFADRWLETSAASSQIALPTSGGPLLHFDFSGSDYEGLEWFRVGTPWYATQVDNVVFAQGTAQLSWSAAPGFDSADGVNPGQGLPGHPFEFRVVYSDDAGLLPEAGFPKLLLDLNGDGDTGDPGEGEHVMSPVDMDSDATDGKTYSYLTNLPGPGTGGYRYAFRARNSDGDDAVGPPTTWTSGPLVADDLYDLAIFANDILFSNLEPQVSEPFTVTIRFQNGSNLPVDDVAVRAESEGVTIFSGSVAHLDPGSTGEVSFEWAFSQEGFYPIRAFVDADDSFPEWNELNNNATRPVVVGDYTLPGSIELVGLPAEVDYSADCQVTFSGLARYLGTETVPPPPVQGGTVTFTPSWTGARAVATNDAGAFTLSIPGPSTSGDYLLLVEATDYTLHTELEIVVHAAAASTSPDLAISVVADPPTACLGDTVRIGWSVTNQGGGTSTATSAVLQTSGQAPVTESVGPLAPGETLQLPDALVLITATGNQVHTARVDPDDVVFEAGECNNYATTSHVAYADCSEWDPDYVRLSDSTPCTGQPVTLSFVVANWGCMPAPATTIRFRVDGAVVEDRPFASLGGNGSQVSVSFSRTFATSGTHSVSFELDPDGLASECNDGNDLISASLQVLDCPTVDYAIDACSIAASNPNPTAGEPITFQATVRNHGPLGGTGAVAVRFLLDGIPIGADVPTASPIPAGGTSTVLSAATWSVDFASHLVEVLVDPDNLVPNEVSELNNEAACPLPHELHPVPIAICPPWSPSMFDDCTPCTGAPVGVLGQVVNTGLFAVAGPVTVVFEDRFSGTPVTIGSADLINLRERGSCAPPAITSFSIVHSFVELGAHPVAFVVDPSDFVPEYDEGNNTYSGSLSVQSCIPLPDLYLRSEHINPEDLNPDPGETLDWVVLTVFNGGSGSASGVLADLNIDGQPLCTDLFLGDLAPGASSSVQCSVPWLVPPGPPNLRILQVLVDPDGLIGETAETNNAATRAIVVGPAPDLYILPEDIHRVRGGIGPTPLWVLVRNAGGGAATGKLALSLLDEGGQFVLIEEIPVSLEPAGIADAELWVQSSWRSSAHEVHVRATLTEVQPQEYDETNNQAEATLRAGPRARAR